MKKILMIFLIFTIIITGGLIYLYKENKLPKKEINLIAKNLDNPNNLLYLIQNNFKEKQKKPIQKKIEIVHNKVKNEKVDTKIDTIDNTVSNKQNKIKDNNSKNDDLIVNNNQNVVNSQNKDLLNHDVIFKTEELKSELSKFVEKYNFEMKNLKTQDQTFNNNLKIIQNEIKQISDKINFINKNNGNNLSEKEENKDIEKNMKEIMTKLEDFYKKIKNNELNIKKTENKSKDFLIIDELKIILKRNNEALSEIIKKELNKINIQIEELEKREQHNYVKNQMFEDMLLSNIPDKKLDNFFLNVPTVDNLNIEYIGPSIIVKDEKNYKIAYITKKNGRKLYKINIDATITMEENINYKIIEISNEFLYVKDINQNKIVRIKRK